MNPYLHINWTGSKWNKTSLQISIITLFKGFSLKFYIKRVNENGIKTAYSILDIRETNNSFKIFLKEPLNQMSYIFLTKP